MRNRFLLLAGLGVLSLVVIGSALAYVYLGKAAAPKILYISPTGLDTNPCTQAKPCMTLQGGFERAKPGMIVEALAGQYPRQPLAGGYKLPRVIFRPAAGQDVHVEWVDITAHDIEIRNFKMNGWNANPPTNNVIMRNIDAGPFGIYGATNLKVLGGDYGPSLDPVNGTTPAYIAYGLLSNVSVGPKNILIDGVRFHDFKIGRPDDHLECLHINGGDGVTIRNSRFTHCDIFSIFFTVAQWGPPATNIMIENNFFDRSTAFGDPDKCCTYYSVRFTDGMPYENATLRYNSALQTFSLGDGPKKNVSVVANVAPLPAFGCDAAVRYAYNVWDKAKCSKTDKKAGARFLLPASLDLHLQTKSAAVNAGSPKEFPRTDIDGQKRPKGKRPDAGADEKR
jgi:hypothetical protein